MQSSQLNKALNIMRRTGDRLIIMDQETDEASVMMVLESYERLLNATQTVGGLSEEEMVEKINRDIALWRAYNESDSLNWYKGDFFGGRKSNKNYFDEEDCFGDTATLEKKDEMSNNNEVFDFENFSSESAYEDEDDEVFQNERIEDKPIDPNNENSWMEQKDRIVEEALNDVPADEDPQFYMEPIE